MNPLEPAAEVAAWVEAAERRIRPHLAPTPVEPSSWLSGAGDAEVVLKLENLQPTGSFKVRGAFSKLLSLPPEVRRRGVVAASTGNHGAAVAHAARRLGIDATVYVPERADPSKLAGISRWGAQLHTVGRDPLETETAARARADAATQTYVSPYNDEAVVGGQGTVALELVGQVGVPDVVIASLGGGGLIAGMAGYLKHHHPQVRVVAASPANSAVMIHSVEAGRIVEEPSAPTLSDGTAGGVEQGAITFEPCRLLVDEFVTITEDEIAASLRGFVDAHHMLIEGAAAVAVAAFSRRRWDGTRVAVVVCGGNIAMPTLRALL